MAINLDVVSPAAANIGQERLQRIDRRAVGIGQHNKIERLVAAIGQERGQGRVGRATGEGGDGHGQAHGRGLQRLRAAVVEAQIDIVALKPGIQRGDIDLAGGHAVDGGRDKEVWHCIDRGGQGGGELINGLGCRHRHGDNDAADVKAQRAGGRRGGGEIDGSLGGRSAAASANGPSQSSPSASSTR